jgi:hypothetical protein
METKHIIEKKLMNDLSIISDNYTPLSNETILEYETIINEEYKDSINKLTTAKLHLTSYMKITNDLLSKNIDDFKKIKLSIDKKQYKIQLI